MSFRVELLAALTAKLAGLTLTGRPTLDLWHGEEAAFNDDAEFPLVAYRIESVAAGPPLEMGAVTFERMPAVALFVATVDGPYNDGAAQALGLLDELETALHEADLAAGAETVRLYWQGDTAAAPAMGRYLWRQDYRSEGLTSR